MGAVTRQPAAKTRVQQAGQKPAPASSQAAKASAAGQQDLPGETGTCRHHVLHTGATKIIGRTKFEHNVFKLPSLFFVTSHVEDVELEEMYS